MSPLCQALPCAPPEVQVRGSCRKVAQGAGTTSMSRPMCSCLSHEPCWAALGMALPSAFLPPLGDCHLTSSMMPLQTPNRAVFPHEKGKRWTGFWRATANIQFDYCSHYQQQLISMSPELPHSPTRCWCSLCLVMSQLKSWRLNQLFRSQSSKAGRVMSQVFVGPDKII